MEWFEKLIAEARILRAAPRASATVFGAVVAATWGTFCFIHGGRIDNLKDALSSKESLLSDYKDKLNGATPAEAKKRLDALEFQVAALSPRRLTKDQIQTISSVLQIAKGSVIDVSNDTGVAEARAFSKDLSLAFLAAGWVVRPWMINGIADPPPSGVALRVRDPSNLGTAEKAAKAALETAHVSFDLQPGLRIDPPSLPESYRKQNPQAQVEILVTTR